MNKIERLAATFFLSAAALSSGCGGGGTEDLDITAQVPPQTAPRPVLATVPEIPDPSINDIAITTMMNGQVVIVFNPIFCQQIGPLVCGFFRAHEYGHVNLGHLILRTHPQQAEFEADCWAARNAPLIEVDAAYRHFLASGFMGGWAHGTGVQRAERLAVCAQGRTS